MSTAALHTLYAVELLERFAYYGSVFIVPMFMTTALGASQQAANAAVNCIFALSPLSSLVAFKPADGSAGKARVLLGGQALYCCGLVLLTIGALPALYTDFPGAPTPAVLGCFCGGVLCLSLGYGAFKTCSAPLVADALAFGCVPSRQRSKYFMIYAGVVNTGALVGTLVPPFLRALAPDTAPDPEDSTRTINTAFYVSFAVCACASFLGVVVVCAMQPALRRVEPEPSHRSWLGECRALVATGDPDAAEQRRTLLQTLKIFAVLPFYWLVQNQFMGNVSFQVQWTTLPSALPTQVFNNINTMSMLIGLVALRAGYRCVGRVPSQRARMLAGFALVALCILYCAGLQVLLLERGHFDEDENYTLYPGKAPVSAWFLVPAYALSGVASALIDPTSLEAAFQRAPDAHKSLVMSLYLVCASASGFLGMAFAPLAAPALITLGYGVMGFVLAVSSLLWACADIRDIDAATVVCADDDATATDLNVNTDRADCVHTRDSERENYARCHVISEGLLHSDREV